MSLPKTSRYKRDCATGQTSLLVRAARKLSFTHNISPDGQNVCDLFLAGIMVSPARNSLWNSGILSKSM